MRSIVNITLPIIATLLMGCQTMSEWFNTKPNPEKDLYIDKIEGIAGEAAAGVLAVQEKLPKDDIKSKVLESQFIRLSGVQKPSIAKLEEQRAIIANNDTKAAAKDKAEAVKVDKETTELYSKVAALDKKLSDANAAKEQAIALSEQATKEKSIWYITAVGLGILTIGIFVSAFTPKKVAGLILVAGGVFCSSSAWIIGSKYYSWIILGTVALVVINLGAAATFAIWRFVRDRFIHKDAGQDDSLPHI